MEVHFWTKNISGGQIELEPYQSDQSNNVKDQYLILKDIRINYTKENFLFTLVLS